MIIKTWTRRHEINRLSGWAIENHIPSQYFEYIICFHTMLSEIVIHHTSWITSRWIVGGWLMLRQLWMSFGYTLEHRFGISWCYIWEGGRGQDRAVVRYHCCWVWFECELSQAAARRRTILSIGYYSTHNKWMMSHLHRCFKSGDWISCRVWLPLVGFCAVMIVMWILIFIKCFWSYYYN